MTHDTQMEMEAKVEVEDLEDDRDSVVPKRGSKKGEFAETDSFFDFEDRRLKMPIWRSGFGTGGIGNPGKAVSGLLFKGPAPGPLNTAARSNLSWTVSRS